MTSFGTGILVALVLAAGAYFAMQAGTIDMVERSETSSTRIANIWDEGTFREMPAAEAQPDGS
ncbi:MAG TPA: hypothetical protein VK090_07030 [Paracoccaceae bacterium]|nr:hypothetical protein [Paracoccaceae bacterium]